MRIAILHNAVPPNARPDESDVLAQVEQIRTAADELGHTHETLSVNLNLQALVSRLRELQPNGIFNLIESLDGSDRLVSLAVAVIESLGIPLTGSSAESLWVTNHKVLTKQKLQLAGLPTPVWVDPESDSQPLARPAGTIQFRSGSKFILKPVSEHASLGMDESAVVKPGDVTELVSVTRRQAAKLHRPCFAEQYVPGREFNVSLLADGESCQVLPLAEIDFSAFPEGKIRIVDYKAKWDSESFEFQHTPRRFLPREAEPELAQRLSRLARDCWSLFQLGGYARVDFRVDESGQPWILEINTNPCLSPDAGFAAALQHAGIPFSQAVQRILGDAIRRSSTDTVNATVPINDIRPSTAVASDTRAAGTTAPSDDRVAWRYEVADGDPAAIRDLVDKTGFFYPDEVDVAEELVLERLAKGAASGYHFVFVEIEGQIVGYASYGHIACTRDSYDLYWIAVDPHFQGQGIGRLVLEQAERCIQAIGGRRVYIETSNREQYLSTRGFYLRCGYACDATLAEFYGPADDKVIYVKSLN